MPLIHLCLVRKDGVPMFEMLTKAMPVSLLLTAIVVFSGLFFKIATQNVKFKQRPLKSMWNQFIFCLVLLLMTAPLVTMISASENTAVPLAFRVIPVVIAAGGVFGMWRAVENIVKRCPKDEPAPEAPTQQPVSDETT